jgi:hypothetical protein
MATAAVIGLSPQRAVDLAEAVAFGKGRDLHGDTAPYCASPISSGKGSFMRKFTA